MGSVNKAILVGNLGRDAELRYTSGRRARGVGEPRDDRAVSRIKEGQKREDTQWHAS